MVRSREQFWKSNKYQHQISSHNNQQVLKRTAVIFNRQQPQQVSDAGPLPILPLMASLPSNGEEAEETIHKKAENSKATKFYVKKDKHRKLPKIKSQSCFLFACLEESYSNYFLYSQFAQIKLESYQACFIVEVKVNKISLIYIVDCRLLQPYLSHNSK